MEDEKIGEEDAGVLPDEAEPVDESVANNELVNQWILQNQQSGDAKTISVVVNNKQITLAGKSNYVFVDIFEKYEFDLHTVKGSKLVQKIDGEDAQHFSPLHNGAVVELYWKE